MNFMPRIFPTAKELENLGPSARVMLEVVSNSMSGPARPFTDVPLFGTERSFFCSCACIMLPESDL